MLRHSKKKVWHKKVRHTPFTVKKYSDKRARLIIVISRNIAINTNDPLSLLVKHCLYFCFMGTFDSSVSFSCVEKQF